MSNKIEITFKIDSLDDLEFFTEAIEDNLGFCHEEIEKYAPLTDKLNQWRLERRMAQAKGLENLHNACKIKMKELYDANK